MRYAVCLWPASAGQNVRAARLLLKHGVEWTRRDKSGSSALHLCAELHTENVRRPRACVRACACVCACPCACNSLPSCASRTCASHTACMCGLGL